MCQQVFRTYTCAHQGTPGEFRECDRSRDGRCQRVESIEEPVDETCDACLIANSRLPDMDREGRDRYNGLTREEYESYFGDPNVSRDNMETRFLSEEEMRETTELYEDDTDYRPRVNGRVVEREDDIEGRLWEMLESEREGDERR